MNDQVVIKSNLSLIRFSTRYLEKYIDLAESVFSYQARSQPHDYCRMVGIRKVKYM